MGPRTHEGRVGHGQEESPSFTAGRKSSEVVLVLMASLMGRNRKRSRTAFSPFTNCPCCAGPTEYGRAAEERLWRQEYADDMVTMDLSIARRRVFAAASRPMCRCHSVHYAGEEPWCLCDSDYADLCEDCG